MRRVVVTGQGIVSSLGNNIAEVTTSLREGRSGLRFNPAYAEHGMRCQVSGRPDLALDTLIDRRTLRFMGDAAAYAYLAMQQAIAQAGLGTADVSNPRTGLVVGSGGASSFNQVWAADTLRAKGIKRVGPFMVTRIMGSTVSACLATPFGIKGARSARDGQRTAAGRASGRSRAGRGGSDDGRVARSGQRGLASTRGTF